MNTNKEDFDVEKAFDELFDIGNDEKIKFEEMVINSNMMEVIKSLMKSNGIKSKAALAEMTDVTPAYISKLFRNDKNFNVHFLAKLQRVFNTSFTFSAKNLSQNTSFEPLNIESKGVFNVSLITDQNAGFNDGAKIIPMYSSSNKDQVVYNELMAK